ncbi:hypothetical protein PGTUg99_022530, partial [Puccinia graminis f. sp. tritici]
LHALLWYRDALCTISRMRFRRMHLPGPHDPLDSSKNRTTLSGIKASEQSWRPSSPISQSFPGALDLNRSNTWSFDRILSKGEVITKLAPSF